MLNPRTFLIVGLAVAVALTVYILAWESPPNPGSVEQLLYSAGTVLRVPGSTTVSFTVPADGGVLVGAVAVDHGSVDLGVGPAGGLLSCPVWVGYSGPAWSYSIDVNLAPGQYVWGALCGGFANITITQPVEVLYP